MLRTSRKVVFVVMLSVIATAACKKKKSKSSSSTINAKNMQELSLSESLKADLPDAVTGTGSASLFLASGKSREACQTRQMIKAGMANISAIGTTLCHLEAEAMAFGKKYNVTFKDGSAELQIFADNSVADQLTIYMCRDGKLETRFVIEGTSGGTSKGSISINVDQDDISFADEVAFDYGFTDEGVYSFIDKGVFNVDTYTFRQFTSVSWGGDVDTVQYSRNGEFGEGGTYADAGGAKFNTEYGQALAMSNNFSDTSNAFRSYFDAAGNNVNVKATTAFAEGESLFMASSDVPGYLDETFSIAETDGWDCGDTVEEIVIDAEGSEAHQACELPWEEFGTEDCYEDAEYVGGNEDDDFDASEQADPEDIELDGDASKNAKKSMKHPLHENLALKVKQAYYRLKH